MKSFRFLTAVIGLSAAFAASVFAAETDAGYVDIGQLMPSAKGQFVEVNLSPGLLKFASRIAAKQEPDAAAIIANLKRVRVNVVSLDESNRKGIVEQIEAVRARLEKEGWTPMVTVREKEDGDNVTVHARQKSDDAIEGLVVTVIDSKGQAVFVNIVGSISADQIATVAQNLNIEPLKHVHLKAAKSHKADDEET
jgi:Skp family chaperone for outer membrane proteins